MKKGQFYKRLKNPPYGDAISHLTEKVTELVDTLDKLKENHHIGDQDFDDEVYRVEKHLEKRIRELKDSNGGCLH